MRTTLALIVVLLCIQSALSIFPRSFKKDGLIKTPMQKKIRDNVIHPDFVRRNEGTTFLYGSINTTFEYYSAISIGSKGQVFTVQVDTGSSSLAVPATGCKQYTVEQDGTLQATGDECDHANNFYSASSSSQQVKCGSSSCRQCAQGDDICQFYLHYGDGSFLTGHLIQDNLTFAGLSTPVRFGQIEAESAGFGGTSVDGILGMAYQVLDPLDGDAVFGKLVEALQCNDSFSMCMGYNGGMLTLGGVDTDYSAGEMVYTPITNESYYVVEMVDVKVGTHSIGVNPNVYNEDFTIVDSGTTLLMLPTEAMNAIIDTFQTEYCPNFPDDLKKLCDASGDSSLFAASSCWSLPQEYIDLFPNISIELAGTGDLAITPDQYFLSVISSGTQYRCFGILGVSGIGAILGDVFMQGYNVHFDRQNKRVGFATVKNCDSFAMQLAKIGGDGQTGALGKSLSEPFQVQVSYEDGTPAVGYQVNFTASGVSFDDNGQAISDGKGIAQITGHIRSPGKHTVTATLVGFPDQVVTFSVKGSLLSIIGIVVGAVVAVAIAIVAIVLIRKKVMKQRLSRDVEVRESLLSADDG